MTQSAIVSLMNKIEYRSKTEYILPDATVYVLDIYLDKALTYWDYIKHLDAGYYPSIGNCQTYLSNYTHDAPSTLSNDLQAVQQFNFDEWLRSEQEVSTDPLHFGEHPLWVPLPLPIQTVQRYRQLHAATIPLMLVPVKDSASWEIPLLLHLDILDGPPAQTHAALWKRWLDKYQAQVICIDHGTVEFTVNHPPITWEQALILAKEHYYYCGDILAQWAWSLNNLAQILLNSRVWYFWWD